MNPFISFCVYVAARVFVQYLKTRPKDQQMNSSLQFLLQAMQALRRKNPLTESFLVQLDLDLESAGIQGLPAKPWGPNPPQVSVPSQMQGLSDSIGARAEDQLSHVRTFRISPLGLTFSSGSCCNTYKYRRSRLLATL